MPDVPDYHVNRGNALRLLGRHEDAAGAYRRALTLAPDLVAAHVNLATVLKQLGRLDEAAAVGHRAAELLPDNAAVHVVLGNVYRLAGRYAAAAAAYRRALEIDPQSLRAYEYLARVLHKAGDDAGAAEVLARWLRHDPLNPVARHMHAAMTGGDGGPRASDGYVRATFDDFADTFDERLGLLDYRAPHLAAEALARALGPARGALDVLDAGCGTGLCGPLLRPYARHLTGVDLSSGMLTKARARDTYDALAAAELTAFLEGAREAFDVIVSTDVLIYFGDLGPVLAAAAVALRPGGCLVFTVEELRDDPARGFRLNPHGRYSHTADHVRQRLDSAPLQTAALEQCVLRTEGGEPVAGLVATARR